jgi:hypothetical protein
MCTCPNGDLGLVYEKWVDNGIQFRRYSIIDPPQRNAIRSYDFTDSGNETTDNGIDGVNCTNNGVSFSSSGGTWDGTADYIDLGETGSLAYSLVDFWQGVRFDFNQIAINDNGNRQVILGTVETGFTGRFRIFVDTAVGLGSHEQGRIVVDWLIDDNDPTTPTVQQAYTAASSYSDGVAFDLSINLIPANNTVEISINGTPVSVTVDSSEIAVPGDEGVKGPDKWGHSYYLGANNNRGVAQFWFDGTMEGFDYFASWDLFTQEADVLAANDSGRTERIPSLTSDANGIYLAYEDRASGSDDAANDLQFASSTDNGATWTENTIRASVSNDLQPGS